MTKPVPAHLYPRTRAQPVPSLSTPPHLSHLAITLTSSCLTLVCKHECERVVRSHLCLHASVALFMQFPPTRSHSPESSSPTLSLHTTQLVPPHATTTTMRHRPPCDDNDGALSLSLPRPHPSRYAPPPTPCPRVDAPHATMTTAPRPHPRLALTHLVTCHHQHLALVSTLHMQ